MRYRLRIQMWKWSENHLLKFTKHPSRKKQHGVISLFQMTEGNHVSLMNGWLCMQNYEVVVVVVVVIFAYSEARLNFHQQQVPEVKTTHIPLATHDHQYPLISSAIFSIPTLSNGIFTYKFKFWWSNSCRINSSLSCFSTAVAVHSWMSSTQMRWMHFKFYTLPVLFI